jgi:trigger factor
MKVTNEKTENRQAYLTIEMEPEEMAKSIGESYQRLAKKASVPGFRKGKAPRDVLERFIGRERVLEEVMNIILPDAYAKALEEQKLKAIAHPDIEVVQNEPVIFKATVPLAPEVELGDYKSIRVEPEVEEVTEERINAVLEDLRHQYANWEPVERAVQFNDLAVLDVESSVEGSAFIEQKAAQYQVKHGFEGPLPGFAEQLEGMVKGEEKEFTLKVPDDYPQAEFAGKDATFKVRVDEIKEEKLPELNDDFARQVGSEYENLEQLKEEVEKRLSQGAEERSRHNFEDKVIQELTDRSKVEFPPVLVEAEIDDMLNEQAKRLGWDEKRLEEYLERTDKTVEQLREEMLPSAEKRVTTSLLLGKVSEEEKIEVSEGEIDAEIERMVGEARERQEELKAYLNTPQSRNSIKNMLLTRRTVEMLLNIARGEGIEQNDKEVQGDD